MSLNTLSSTIHKALSAAGLDPNSKRLAAVADTIRNALNAAGLVQAPVPRPHATAADPAAPVARTAGAANSDRSAQSGRSERAKVEVGEAGEVGEVAEVVGAPHGIGPFNTFTYANGKAQRDYKLYVPSTYTGQAMPLIVMLHGCKQNPADFARGTRMNELAEQHGFLVVYPAQTMRANGSNCWNWFNRAEQTREGEEPSLIAGMVGHVAASYEVDSSRVFAAGLSAGAAMATIVGARYPEVFKAVAVHSGLPLGAAHDVPSAFAAMRGRPRATTEAAVHAVPTLVFHGDADTTVVASNGRLVVEQAVNAFEASAPQPLTPQAEAPQRVGGRDCTVTRYVDAAGRAQVEAWLVSGAGHAWFGGSNDGSYTDAKGPDASAEMVRFFLTRESASA